MRYSVRFLVVLGMATIFAVTAGCSGQSGLASVSGTVTVDGKPLQHGAIIFEVEGNRPSYGRVEDGQIVDLSTFAFMRLSYHASLMVDSRLIS